MYDFYWFKYACLASSFPVQYENVNKKSALQVHIVFMTFLKHDFSNLHYYEKLHLHETSFLIIYFSSFELVQCCGSVPRSIFSFSQFRIMDRSGSKLEPCTYIFFLLKLTLMYLKEE